MLKYYFIELVGKGLLKAYDDISCSLVKLLCVYFSYFNLLNHEQPVLNNIFFQ